MIPFIMRNFVVHLDGTPLKGEGDELKIPALELQTEEYRGGGMDIPIEVDLGMKMLEASFKLFSFTDEIFKRFGLSPGNTVPLTFRGHLVGENKVTRRVIVNMRAVIKKVDPGNWNTGKRADLDVVAAVHYFKLTHGETIVVEIDPFNSIRRINGVDQLTEMRINLGY